jgi:hypothetical protein
MTVTAFPDSNLNDLHHSVINQQLSGEILHLAQKNRACHGDRRRQDIILAVAAAV